MIKLNRILLGVLCTLSVASTYASDEAVTAYQGCIHCHGEQAEGKLMTGAPALAGQHAAYLERQLNAYRSGIRGTHPDDVQGRQMKPMADLLRDDQVALLAAYLSDLEPPAQEPDETADLKNGNNYYQASCGACHGNRAQGNPALNAPALAWLDSSYLKRHMALFQAGIRGSHPDDKYGRQMKMMANSLPDEKTLDDVIAFMQSLGASR